MDLRYNKRLNPKRKLTKKNLKPRGERKRTN